ncbi:MAG: hypothetical protein JWP03_5499 [Phycisphaerales bacterium]|nr:hypothetical protein [Phycisphaerales bacterium]
MSEMNPLPEDPGNRPPPLDYRSAGSGQSPQERRRSFQGFFGGLLLGTLVSVVAWGCQFSGFGIPGLGSSILLLPGLKLGAGVVGLCMPRWRKFGAGILVSIALGILIFFGMCAFRVATN